MTNILKGIERERETRKMMYISFGIGYNDNSKQRW